jgi:hypothetical protein
VLDALIVNQWLFGDFELGGCRAVFTECWFGFGGVVFAVEVAAHAAGHCCFNRKVA